MAKGLRSFPESERRRIAERRAASNTKGLGYWGALDYLAKAKKLTPTLKKRGAV